jgi:nucleotide-binding universal stress UspA family protein
MTKIIACIDGSAISNDVCSAAAWAGSILDKTLVLLHAIEKPSLPMTSDLSGAIGLGARSELMNEIALLDEQHSKVTLKLGKELLNHAENRVKNLGHQQVEKIQRHGGIVEAICYLEPESRLVVIGRTGENHGTDFKAVGSHIEQIIRQTHTPILIASKGFTQPESFMLAYDGRETADRAVDKIIAGGLLQNLTCHLVSVKNKQKKLEESFKRVEALLVKNGFEVKSSLLEGNIFTELSNYQEKNNIDMMVMGALSRSRIATMFLGSNTLKMIESTQLPLIVLR